MSRERLRAGAAQVDISPPLGVQLVGYPTVNRPNTGIHDPLYASCLVLDDGRTRIAIIAADLLGFEKAYAGRVRDLVQRETGIPTRNVLLSASHTHAGPRMATQLFDEELALGGRVEHEYLRLLETRLVELAGKAAAGLRDARIGFGEGRIGAERGIGGNRHDPAGRADPSVGVIGVQDARGGWIAVLVRYSLHPTVLQMDNTLVSADYPWGIREVFAERHPGVVFQFVQGATGDQSSRYFRTDQTFAEARRFGRAIGEEADRILGGLAVTDAAALAADSAAVDPVWKEPPSVAELEQRIARYWSELRDLEAAGASYVDRQNSYLNRLGAEFTLSFARLRQEGRTAPWEHEVPLEVQAIAIGDACIVGLAGEVFVEYTLAIGRDSPFARTFVLTLANGLSPGYLVDRESVQKGSYEAGASMVKPETGDLVVHAAQRLVRDLHERSSRQGGD